MQRCLPFPASSQSTTLEAMGTDSKLCIPLLVWWRPTFYWFPCIFLRQGWAHRIRHFNLQNGFKTIVLFFAEIQSNTPEVKLVKKQMNKKTPHQHKTHRTKNQNKTKQMKEMRAKSESPETHLFKTLVNLCLCSWTRRNPVWNTESKESYSIALSILMELYHIL